MAATTKEITNVEVEHLLGFSTGKPRPLVKLRVTASDGSEVEGQPDAAYQIAEHLITSSARANYEFDLATEAQAQGWEDNIIGGLLHLVRKGEEARLGTTHVQGEPT